MSMRILTFKWKEEKSVFQEESGPAPLMCGGIQWEDDVSVPATRWCGVLGNPGENHAGAMTEVEDRLRRPRSV